jgi:hypothetical protein
MSKLVHTIWSFEDRKHLAGIIMDPARVPAGTRVHFTGGKRTAGQNTRMWGTLTSISEQTLWYGVRLAPEDWKDIFSAGLKSARVVPNLEGNGFVVLGLHTSNLSTEEADNLQEMIYEFGARRGVVFNEPRASPGLPPPDLSEREIERSQSRIRALFAAAGEDLDKDVEF